MAAILCKNGCVNPHQQQWWPVQDVPQCSWNILSTRLLCGCCNILVKQTGGWSGWKGLPTGTNAGRCFQCSLQNSDSLTERKRRRDEQRNALLHASVGDPVGPAELPSISVILGRRGDVKSIFLMNQKKIAKAQTSPFLQLLTIYSYLLVKFQGVNRARSKTRHLNVV